MIIKAFESEWFQDYKVPSMFIAFPKCTFKCEKECEKRVCQNSALAKLPDINIEVEKLCRTYLINPITRAIVCGGLEPLDSFDELYNFVQILRTKFDCKDEIIIYTGYTENECKSHGWVKELSVFKNIIIKFGRFIPNQKSHYDDILGVNLQSDNQYAKRIS